ncbi:MAG TPA: T9SS type A sorting domain-containing protein, partial [Ignavibacteria bacterium]
SCYPSGARVADMKVLNNSLYVSGNFTKIGGVNANKIACYNGQYWCPVEFGIDVKPVRLEVYKGDLIVNGFFNSISGYGFGNIAAYKPHLTFTGGPKNSGIADKYMLFQNYPNPFNPKTIINYELPITNYVKLVIYDISGREVKTLINEKQNAGRHNIDFDGANLSSGVYFYRLTADEFSETKKMLLVK